MASPRLLLCAGLVLGALPAQANWTALSPKPSPPPRYYPGLAYDEVRSELVMFGGHIGPGQGLGDTWVFDGRGWQQRFPSPSPSPRGLHAMVYDSHRQRVVLFGGGTSDGTDETWEWDGVNWTRIDTQHAPSPRAGHGMAYDAARRCVLLFGGGAVGEFLADTWAFDGTDWTELSPRQRPPGRTDIQLAYDSWRERVVLFGGFGESGLVLDDTWEWGGCNWVERRSGTRPRARKNHLMAYDAFRQRVVVFGGAVVNNPSGLVLDDTWEWDGDVWLERSPGSRPGIRAAGALAFDSTQRRMLLFAGLGPSDLSGLGDTWEYSTASPAIHDVFGPGCAGTLGRAPTLAAVPGSHPWLGDSFSVELCSLPSNFVVGILGVSDRVSGTLTLPFDLTAIGMTGCTLYVSLDDLQTVSNNGGCGIWTIPIPNQARLVGKRFFQQGFVFDFGANPLGAVVTNAGAGTIGAR